MSTRGFVSFAVAGETKTAYCHHEPGSGVLAWARTADMGAAATAARALRVVADGSEPTDEDFDRLRPFYNASVGGRSERPTWYQLLRETQGDPAAILAAGVIEDASYFPADSLFAEWGYVVDFDARTFEVYEGFQEEPHTVGRFAADKANPDGYYPVKLVASWPLTALPDNAAFLAALEPAEGGGS
ncbi:hypothetical protein [Streptomyces sp. NPDC005244]|uniref:hypothetical protein n=1 Tax=Streptomyces sp. NPDC005244 TaxID=3364708 RepID=UPI0036C671DF